MVSFDKHLLAYTLTEAFHVVKRKECDLTTSYIITYFDIFII